MSLADLSRIEPQKLARIAPVYSDLVFALGLAITRDDGSPTPIPAVLSPTVVRAADLAARTRLAGRIGTAAFKVARALLASDRRGILLDPLAPLERRIIEATWPDIHRLAVSRVDFLEETQGRLKALELNAALPSLVGYSDIAAQSFIRALGHERNEAARNIAKLISKNGSNAQALLNALVLWYQDRGGARPTPSVALVGRRNDPHLTELAYLAQAFTTLGHPAYLASPDDLSLDGDEIRANGRRVDILYRHVPGSLLEEGSALAKVLAEPSRFMVFNPLDPHLESKATFAELSAAGSDPALARSYGLAPEEVELARSALAWTRRLVPGPAFGPDGTRIPDLPAFVAAHPDQLVLKRAWDRGGGAIFVGPFLAEVEVRAQIRRVFGADLDWKQLVERAVGDKAGGYVVQQYVDCPRRDLQYCDANGELRTGTGFFDFSAFASVGLEGPHWGGACRASLSSPVVNLALGGGVMPLLREDVARALVE